MWSRGRLAPRVSLLNKGFFSIPHQLQSVHPCFEQKNLVWLRFRTRLSEALTMCKIVFSAIPTSPEMRDHEGERGFPSPMITPHTDKHSQDPTQAGV